MSIKVLKKITSLFLDIFVYLFLIITLLLSLFSFFNKKSFSNAVGFFNYETRIVLTNSMEATTNVDVSKYKIKDIPANSLVLIERIPKESEKKDKWLKSLKAGDVLTFNYSYLETSVITHRITKISQNETGGYIIELKGDNNGQSNMPLTQVIDTSLNDTPNYIIGKVKGKSLFLGQTLIALNNPVIMILSIIFPCCLIIIYELYKIARAKFSEKLAQKDEHIAYLEAKLESISIFIKENEQWNKTDTETES